MADDVARTILESVQREHAKKVPILDLVMWHEDCDDPFPYSFRIEDATFAVLRTRFQHRVLEKMVRKLVLSNDLCGGLDRIELYVSLDGVPYEDRATDDNEDIPCSTFLFFGSNVSRKQQQRERLIKHFMGWVEILRARV
jgi:hypothetical protein